MLEQMIEGYVGALAPGSKKNKRSNGLPKSVHRVLKRAFKRKWHHLAEERLEDVTPTIPLGKCFWPLSTAEKREMGAIFKVAEVQHLITSLRHRDEDDKVEVMDAAYWMKGCSSLGRLRFAVLIRVGGKKKDDTEFCLIDIKEAVKPAAPRQAKAQMPSDNAKRVVEGARRLSPFLGERMLPWRLLDRTVVLRELLPQDLKLEMDQLTRDEAIAAARFLASVVGEAHAQQMDHETRKSWRSELRADRSKNLDAPSWLWRSVVELVSSHESAYLEHCRMYALGAGKNQRRFV